MSSAPKRCRYCGRRWIPSTDDRAWIDDVCSSQRVGSPECHGMYVAHLKAAAAIVRGFVSSGGTQMPGLSEWLKQEELRK